MSSQIHCPGPPPQKKMKLFCIVFHWWARCLGLRPRAKNVRTEMAMQQKPAKRQKKQYAVEETVDSRYGVDGSIEYHVRWADYGPEHNTWQGWGTLQGVEWMLDAFDDLQQPP